MLPVRLASSEDVWPERAYGEGLQRLAPLAERRLEELIDGDAGAFAERRAPGALERLREQERRMEAIRVDTEQGVDPGSVVVDRDLRRVLRSGRLVVSGFCVFDPTAPLDPAATVPNARARDARKFEDIGGSVEGLTYPGDF